MAIRKKRRAPAAILPLILAVSLVFPHPVFGITLGEEEELAREILRIIFKRYEVIEDPAIAGYVSRVGNRIQGALPEQPFRFRFYVLNDPSYNAFATPGGHIFVFSGLLAAMEEEDELAGILGHEIAHVTCRHISQKIELAKKVGWATLAGMAAGVLIGAAGGAAAAASGVIMGSAAAGATTQLAFSRENEMQSDQLGLKYLGDAGYGAGGLLKVLKKIRSKVWYGKEQIPSYMMTHPAIEDRIVYVGSWIESAPAAKRTAADPAEFERMQTRLIADYSDTHAELNRLGEELRRQPADVLSRYRYALVLAKADRREESIAQFKEALARRAFDPYMLRDLGKVYFADGKLAQAQSALESARATIPNDPDCLFYLGRTRQELGQRAEALALYSAIVQKTPAYREAYYFLGKGLGEQGNLTDAHYYLGIYHAKGRDYKTAAIQFRQALKQNPEPDIRERIERFLLEVETELKSERERRPTD